MKAIPNPGTYPAACSGAMVVYETESGALCVAVPVKITGGTEVAWQGKHTVTLVKKDGALNLKSIETMKKVFGWDGLNPFDLEDLDTSGVDFEIVGEHENYLPDGETEERTSFKIQWLNPIGGSTNMPEKVEDRKALLAKFGSKFKAVSSKPAASKPAASAAPSKPAPAKAPPAGPPSRPRTAAGQKRTSTSDEVWAALVKTNPDENETTLGEKFYAAQDEVAPEANGELTPVQWGAVAESLGV